MAPWIFIKMVFLRCGSGDAHPQSSKMNQHFGTWTGVIPVQRDASIESRTLLILLTTLLHLHRHLIEADPLRSKKCLLNILLFLRLQPVPPAEKRTDSCELFLANCKNLRGWFSSFARNGRLPKTGIEVCNGGYNTFKMVQSTALSLYNSVLHNTRLGERLPFSWTAILRSHFCVSSMSEYPGPSRKVRRPRRMLSGSHNRLSENGIPPDKNLPLFKSEHRDQRGSRPMLIRWPVIYRTSKLNCVPWPKSTFRTIKRSSFINGQSLT